jgi:hypothetical protein
MPRRDRAELDPRCVALAERSGLQEVAIAAVAQGANAARAGIISRGGRLQRTRCVMGKPMPELTDRSHIKDCEA